MDEIHWQADESMVRSRARRETAKRERRLKMALTFLVFLLVVAVFTALIVFFPR